MLPTLLGPRFKFLLWPQDLCTLTPLPVQPHATLLPPPLPCFSCPDFPKVPCRPSHLPTEGRCICCSLFRNTPPLPSRPDEHPAILSARAFQEAFSNPLPGLQPPRRLPVQPLCYLHIYFLVLCPSSTDTMPVLFTSVFPASTTGLRHHSVFKKYFLNNQGFFQTSRIRRLLPRIFTNRNRTTHGGYWEPNVSCPPHHRLRTWVWWVD